MSKHIKKCKWCIHGSYSYKWSEWNCWYDERPLTDSEAKKGCDHFKPNKDCPENIIKELNFDLEEIKLNL